MLFHVVSQDCIHFSSDSTLSEEEEIEEDVCFQEPKENQMNHTEDGNTVTTMFPLRITPKDLEFCTIPIHDKGSRAREITFSAVYRKLKVICVGIFNGKASTRTALFIEGRHQYEWDMSNALSICRSVATYIDYIEMSPNEMNIKYLSNEPVGFFIKPYYQNGILRTYMNDKAKRGTHC